MVKEVIEYQQMNKYRLQCHKIYLLEVLEIQGNSKRCLKNLREDKKENGGAFFFSDSGLALAFISEENPRPFARTLFMCSCVLLIACIATIAFLLKII